MDFSVNLSVDLRTVWSVTETPISIDNPCAKLEEHVCLFFSAKLH